MRKLATIAFSFAAATFASVLLPWDGWHLWAACALLLCAVVAALVGREYDHTRRALLILCSMAVALAYFDIYRTVICGPVVEQCGEEHPFVGIVTDYPTEANRGEKVTLWLRPGVKAVYYGDLAGLELQPGQRVSGTAQWQNAAQIRGNDLSTFTAKGEFVLLMERDALSVEPYREGSMLFFPQRAARAVKVMIGRIWDDPATESFMLAELTGDRSHISEEHSVIMSETGLSHLFAVSGLHCALLVSLLGLLIPPTRRRLFAAIAIVVLLFYMLMVGMTPSVVRACVMQIALLVAPLFKRDSDSLTSLGAALLLLLILNPYAAGGIGLQLSFAATLGLVLLSGKIHLFLSGLYRGKRRKVKFLVSMVSANVSASLSVLVFTVPLTAYYFNILTLISPLSNLLAVPVAGWNFMVGLVTVLLGFIWLPAARIVGWLNWAMVHYILLVTRWLMGLPGHALYFANRYLKYWLTYVYLLLGICCLTKGKKRRYVLAGLLAVLTLLFSLGLNSREYHYGAVNAMAIDVGQGECVLLYSGSDAVLVDCGSSNSYIDAGRRAADQISSMGIQRLSAVVLTHYHADHANGMIKLLSRIPTDRLWLADIEDEFGVRDRLVDFASQHGIEVRFIRDSDSLSMGEAELTVLPPIGKGDMNEQGLTILCSAGDFDVLITGDMAGSTERQLIDAYDLPDIELLVVSHHGSKNSSDPAFLKAVRPEIAVICVGDNSYGHPTEEAMRRLLAAGAELYRTDTQGNILITVHGGEN